jgi:uncharacterized membrane protein YfcA
VFAYALLFVAGLFGGFAGGILGIGGGVIYVLVLPLVLTNLGVPEHELVAYTIANSLFATFISAVAANYLLIKRKQFFLRPVLLISLPGVVTSLLCLTFIVQANLYSPFEFNVVVICLLIVMLLRMVFTKPKPARTLPLTWQSLVPCGLGSGMISALSGLGGGIVVIPYLNSLLQVDIKKSTSISLGVIAVTAFAASVQSLLQPSTFKLGALHVGHLVISAVLVLSAGVLIGSPLGVKAAHKLQPRHIQIGFSVFLLLVITHKLLMLIKWV